MPGEEKELEEALRTEASDREAALEQLRADGAERERELEKLMRAAHPLGNAMEGGRSIV